MANKAVAVLGFTLLVLLAVIAIPIAVDSTEDTTIETVSISENNSTTVNGDIGVFLTNSQSSQATVRIVNNENGNSIENTIQEGSTAEYSFSEGTISVSADSTRSKSSILLVEYPNTFGYAENMSLITDNLALILLVMVFIGVMAFVGVGIGGRA